MIELLLHIFMIYLHEAHSTTKNPFNMTAITICAQNSVLQVSHAKFVHNQLFVEIRKSTIHKFASR